MMNRYISFNVCIYAKFAFTRSAFVIFNEEKKKEMPRYKRRSNAFQDKLHIIENRFDNKY